MGVEISIIRKSKDLPQVAVDRFFHSAEYFRMVEATPGSTPLMAVARGSDGRVVGQLVAVLYRRGSLIPPYLFSQGVVVGEGWYVDDSTRHQLFPDMLAAMTHALQHRLCLYIEFIEPSSKMFGYRSFRRLGYFPISWMHIHNSLHSKKPEERLSDKMLHRIHIIGNSGLTVSQVENDDEADAVARLLRSHYRLRPWRLIPKKELLRQLSQSGNGRILATRWRGKLIGGSVLVYSGTTAYLWYLAARDKSHPMLHPRQMTMWASIKRAYDDGMEHIIFLNVGLPFRANRWREFILSFGGKSVGTYRWFRFNLKWLNKFLTFIAKE